MPEFPTKVRRRFRVARSKGQKQALAPKEPTLLVAQQSRTMIKFLDEIFEIIRSELFPVLINTERQDALPTIIQSAINIIELRVGQIIDAPTIEEASEKAAGELVAANKRQWKRLLQVDVDPEVQPLLRQFVKNNSSLIKSQSSQVVARIRNLIDNRVGARAEDLAKEIEHVFGVRKSKARFIARDQVLKLHGNIAQATQTSIGIEMYEWVTAGDGNVRETHTELNGTIHRWDTPPVVSDDGRQEHPGGDFNCRCVPLAIIPD
jgi:SPP1 gp7 family putative phage head morphogenesis protein